MTGWLPHPLLPVLNILDTPLGCLDNVKNDELTSAQMRVITSKRTI